MNEQRRLLLESLESRQLLAAVCVPLSDLAAGEETPPAAGDVVVEGEPILQDASSAASPDLGFSDPYYLPSYVFGRDLIHQQGNRLFVVDQDGFSSAGHLHVFERTSDGALETVKKIKVNFRVERMIVHEQQIVLIGRQADYPFPVPREAVDTLAGSDAPSVSWRPIPGATLVMTVNLHRESDVASQEVVRQEFDTDLQIVDQLGDRLVVQSSLSRGPVITIFPPPQQSDLLRVFQITPEGLRETASRKVPADGLVAVAGDTVLVTHTRYVEIVYLDNGLPVDPAGGEPIRPPDDRPLPHYQQTASVAQYKIGADAIQLVSELELGDGFVHNLHLSSDAQTAIAVRSGDRASVSDSAVEILDLSGRGVERFASVRVSGRALALYGDYVLLNGHDAGLIVVDTNKEIDVAAESRIRRIELPEGFFLRQGMLRGDDDRVVLMLERWQERRDSPPPEVPLTAETGIPTRLVFESIVLAVSLRDAAVVGDTRLSEEARFAPPYEFTAIDPANHRFGFFVQNDSAIEDRGRRFVFGRLGDDGEFVRDGAIPVGNWLEIEANAERLIVREPDRLLEYRWHNIDDPVVTPLGDPPPPIEAIDDQFEVIDEGHEQLLDVLANDLAHQHLPHLATQVVDLIGAPAGVEIVAGRLVRIPASVLETTDSLRFEYVISDGRSESRAAVDVRIRTVNEEAVRELVQRVRRHAAEDFGVSVDEVNITSVERIFDQPLPIVFAGDQQRPLDLSPGILVTLTVPDATALYAASLDGQIVQVFSSRREFLVELGLRAVDDRGAPISEVVEGQEFWIEFTAKDLREFGRGVYAAFFDLVVPSEHIVLTGSIDYGDGFQSIRTGSLGDGFVDDVGAVSNQIESPGNGLQRILRIGAKAIATGAVTLTPDAADAAGTESLIRGRETVVPEHAVRFSSLTLNIVDPPQDDPLDADGSGTISAVDALVILNFLHRFGTTPVAELAERIARVRGEAETLSGDQMTAMRRYDTNANGTITTLDALIVINRLSRDRLRNSVNESAFAVIGSDLDDDDDDEVTAWIG